MKLIFYFFANCIDPRDFLFLHKKDKGEVMLDTRELREVLIDVPLDSYDVIKWIEENLAEQYNEI